MSRSSSYAQGGGAQGESFSKQMQSELRRHIRKLRPHAPFSEDWFTMLESLQRIASVAYTEQGTGTDKTLAGASRVPLLGMDDSQATLWERNQLSVRYLLEEGKLNLSLRILSEYKQFVAGKDLAVLLGTGHTPTLGLDRDGLILKMQLFEQSIGVLLKCALENVEAVQTVDQPLLVEYLERMYNSEDPPPANGLEWSQETMSILYLESLGKQLGHLDAVRLFTMVVQHNLFRALLQHVKRHASVLKKPALQASARALALFMDTDEFDTQRDKIFADDRDQTLLVEVYEAVFKTFTRDLDLRRSLQPLIDCYREYQ